MKQLTFDEIYNDILPIQDSYLKSTLDKIKLQEIKYILNFDKTFKSIPDEAYFDIKNLFLDFAKDLIDFNEEFRAKKRAIAIMIRLMKKGIVLTPMIASVTISAINDFARNLKEQTSKGVKWYDVVNVHSEITKQKLMHISSILLETNSNYTFNNLRDLKNNYNTKLDIICKKYNLNIGRFKAFRPYEQILINYKYV